MKKTAGIYKLTSPSGKVYIGQTYNLCKRFSNYEKMYCKQQPKLYNALVKYGWENFKKEILYETDKTININYKEILNVLEKYYIKLYKCVKNGYNCMSGGDNSSHSEETRKKMSEARKGKTPWNKGIPLSEEAKKKSSESLKGKTAWNKGIPHSEEFKKKLSESQKGRTAWNKDIPLTEETRKKLSESLKGKTAWNKGIPLTEETRKKMSEARKGKTHSEETRKKLSEAQKGKTHSEETRKRISINKIGEKNSMFGKTAWNKGIPRTEEFKKKLSKKINKYDLDGNYIESYISISDAAVKNNGRRTLIGSVCIGKRNKTAGYKWKYFDDDPIENPIYN